LAPAILGRLISPSTHPQYQPNQSPITNRKDLNVAPGSVQSFFLLMRGVVRVHGPSRGKPSHIMYYFQPHENPWWAMPQWACVAIAKPFDPTPARLGGTQSWKAVICYSHSTNTGTSFPFKGRTKIKNNPRRDSDSCQRAMAQQSEDSDRVWGREPYSPEPACSIPALSHRFCHLPQPTTRSRRDMSMECQTGLVSHGT
jgi:hypothetical protein